MYNTWQMTCAKRTRIKKKQRSSSHFQKYNVVFPLFASRAVVGIRSCNWLLTTNFFPLATTEKNAHNSSENFWRDVVVVVVEVASVCVLKLLVKWIKVQQIDENCSSITLLYRSLSAPFSEWIIRALLSRWICVWSSVRELFFHYLFL